MPDTSTHIKLSALFRNKRQYQNIRRQGINKTQFKPIILIANIERPPPSKMSINLSIGIHIF